MVAEVVLFSEGFEDSKVLSCKMVQLYKLANEQLSQQVRKGPAFLLLGRLHSAQILVKHHGTMSCCTLFWSRASDAVC